MEPRSFRNAGLFPAIFVSVILDNRPDNDFFSRWKKKKEFEKKGGGEKEERERDISCEGITVEFRLISMEAFSFSSDRLARRIVERTNERTNGGGDER